MGNADDPKKNWRAARAALMDTYDALLKFKTKCPCILDGPYKGKYFWPRVFSTRSEAKNMIEKWYKPKRSIWASPTLIIANM